MVGPLSVPAIPDGGEGYLALRNGVGILSTLLVKCWMIYGSRRLKLARNTTGLCMQDAALI